MSSEKKLFLLDAYALIFRAYYAFISNPMTNSRGVPTSAVFGFTLALEEILRKEDPTHMALVLDPPGPTFRNDLYTEYKANRDETPEEIKSAVPYIKRLMEGFRIPVLEVPGYEADDVIGTLSKVAEKEGFTVYMMTPDKDFAQLVSDRIFMYKPGRSGNPAEVLGLKEVQEKFLVEHPGQVVDILALWGDTSDNIPGAPGIGEKTAKKLISRFGSVDGVYAQIDQLKGKQKENLEKSRDQVFLSRDLAQITLDVPVDLTPDQMERQPMDREKLQALFDELEFKNIADRIFSLEGGGSEVPGETGTLFGTGNPAHQASSRKNIDSVDHTYEVVDSGEELKKLARELGTLNAFCFDTETTGIDPMEAEVVGISFSWEPHTGVYVPFPPEREAAAKRMRLFSAAFQDPGIEKIGQNLKYDLHILKTYGLSVKGPLFDTMVAHFLLKPDQKHNLDSMAEHYLDYDMVKIEELIGKKGGRQSSFRSVPLDQAKEYACEDADITLQLAGMMREEIKNEALTGLSEKIEMPLVRILMEMEHQGVRLDVEALKGFAHSLREEILSVEEVIFHHAGTTFNISSPKQLGEILFERLRIVEDPKKTRTRQYATGEEVLLRLSDTHPIVDKVLEYRSLKKLLNTYVEALPQLVKQKTGKIHTSYNQAQVTTGRLSSNNPNLQNIPIREERGREIRKAFIPEDPEHIFLSADYSQIELRLMAHLSNDTAMVDAFVNEEDIHTTTAAKIFKTEPDAVTREMRGKAKTANFGIIYGISAFGLSQRMGIPRGEAKALIDGYFETYPGVRRYMDECIRTAREKGFVETMYGRRRFLPDIQSRNSVVRGNAERNAINSPIQGSAADIIKIAMIRIQEAVEEEGLKSKMILQVHDELNFDVWPGELDRMMKLVRSNMEEAVRLKVPLTVDMGYGSNWLEAH